MLHSYSKIPTVAKKRGADLAGRKTEYKEDEIEIFDDACMYKRGDYWQFKLWLEKEKK
jgi:hypothetical protein|tara:strand:- start:1207 stop:1380 length:174 start_codon:yes stop_codon:yes gene_type:complete